MEEVYQGYGIYAVDQNESGETVPREKWEDLERNSRTLVSLDASPPYWPNYVKVLVSYIEFHRTHVISV